MHRKFLRNLIISSTALVAILNFSPASHSMEDEGYENKTSPRPGDYAPGDEEKYQDNNGMWHAANGQYTTEPEVMSEYKGVYEPLHQWLQDDD